MRRVGIFGGSFSPVHHGHLLAARAALEALKLDEMIVVPCGKSAYGKKLMPAALRLKLLRAALRDEKKFTLSDIEVKRPGISRTIDTLFELVARADKPAAYFLLIGADQVASFPGWHKAELLSRLTKICVMGRPEAQKHPLIHKKFRMMALNIPQYEISSSEVRARLKKKLSVRWLVPGSVSKLLKK